MLAVAKALFWNLTLMIYSYEKIESMVINEATSIDEKLLRRLVMVFGRRVYEKMKF